MSNPNDQSSYKEFCVKVQEFFADRPNLKSFRWTQYGSACFSRSLHLIEADCFTYETECGVRNTLILASEVEDFLFDFGDAELIYIFGEGATVIVTREEIVVENPNEEVFD